MSCAASTGMGASYGLGWGGMGVAGGGARWPPAWWVLSCAAAPVRPVPPARNRHAAIEWADVPVDPRGHLAAVLGPDGNLPAMILGSLDRVQPRPQRGLGHTVHLAAERAVAVRRRAGIRAQVDDPPRHLARANEQRAAVEQVMQTESPHQRAVGEEQVGGWRDGAGARGGGGVASAARQT